MRLALRYKNIDYDYVSVDIHHLTAEEKEEYKLINPMGQIPALKIDGQILTQSMSICEYLEETRGNGLCLFPGDSLQKFKIRSFCEIVNSYVQPLQNHDQQASIVRGLRALERSMTGHHGPYCFGSDISVADFCLVPQVYNAIEVFAMHDLMAECPGLMERYTELMKVPEFQATAPEQQPGFPKADSK